MSETTTQTPNNANTSATPNAEEPTVSVVDTLFDLGLGWAAQGLKMGKMALEQSAKTLEQTAKALEGLAKELEKKDA